MMVIALGPTQTPSSSSISLHHLKLHQQLHRYSHGFSSFSLTNLKPQNYNIKRKNRRTGLCRSELNGDSLVYAAIGASVLSSLLLPNARSADADSDDSAMTSTDTRLAVMGIVSFIPYFNWLSWVFAWLDSGERRYGVYAIVYLVPYLRSNFSLYPEDSWLPIASIIFCIIHIQLEVSIANGDFPRFELFKDATRKKDVYKEESGEIYKEEIKTESKTLSSGGKQSTDDMKQWGVPDKKQRELQSDEDDDWHRQ